MQVRRSFHAWLGGALLARCIQTRITCCKSLRPLGLEKAELVLPALKPTHDKCITVHLHVIVH